MFLERGYLQPGQTAEQRIREIAETAEVSNRTQSRPPFAPNIDPLAVRVWG
jgi:hypothetical protein